MLVLYGFVDFFYLVEIKLAGEHHHISPAGPEAQCLYVGDVKLGGNVDFHPYAAGVFYGGDIRGYDGINPCLQGTVEGLAHRGKVLWIKYYVERKVAAHTGFAAYADHFGQVFRGEVIGTPGAHVEAPDAKVHRVGTALYGSSQALEIACGSHYLQIFP